MRTRLIVTVLIAMFAIAVLAGPASAQWVRTFGGSTFPGFCQNS